MIKMTLDLRSSELEHNIIKERIKSIEKNFSDLSTKLSCYIKKQSNLGDSGEELAKSISSFASKETYNQTLRLALGEFAEVLASIQDYRVAEVNRTQVKVIDGLNSYHQQCSDVKNDVKRCFDARMKEIKKKNEFEKARSKNAPNWQKITQAEKEVNKAQEEAARMNIEMAKLIKRFEKKKLKDLKNYFLEFVNIEMIFHCKAIELYTKSYNLLKGINVEDDVQAFTSRLNGLSQTDNIEVPPSCSNDTIPKLPDVNTESSSFISYRPQALNDVQGNSRSVFTHKAILTDIDDSNLSSGDLFESKYESKD